MDEKDKCKKCNGKKLTNFNTHIEVAVEPGVPNDHDYIFNGMSDDIPGILYWLKGGMAGDVHVRIKIENHKTFTRKGADLFMNHKITLLEALTGTNFCI